MNTVSQQTFISLSFLSYHLLSISYLSNVVTAFGMGEVRVLSLLKELLVLPDSDLSQRLSGASSQGGDEALITQRIARLRGVLACSPVCEQTK